MEVSSELLAESKSRSVEFAQRPESYSGFSFTRDRKLIMACIEPGDPLNTTSGSYKVAMQTPGALLGEGLDQALTVYAYDHGETTVATGMEQNSAFWPYKAFDAHNDCAFNKNLIAVTEEMADPSGFTKDSIQEWADHFNEREHVDATLRLLMDAAGVQLGLLHQTQDEDLVQHADHLFPNHHNVYDVRRPLLARMYVMGMHPHLGKDRNMKPADPDEELKVQFYHDTLAANCADLATAYSMSSIMRGLRFTALLLRSAAARTVITRDKMAEMTFLEVLPAQNVVGLEIKQRNFS